MPTATRAPDKAVYLKSMPEDLWRQAKAAAALEGVTISDWIQRAIREALKKARR